MLYMECVIVRTLWFVLYCVLFSSSSDKSLMCTFTNSLLLFLQFVCIIYVEHEQSNYISDTPTSYFLFFFSSSVICLFSPADQNVNWGTRFLFLFPNRPQTRLNVEHWKKTVLCSTCGKFLGLLECDPSYLPLWQRLKSKKMWKRK